MKEVNEKMDNGLNLYKRCILWNIECQMYQNVMLTSYGTYLAICHYWVSPSKKRYIKPNNKIHS